MNKQFQLFLAILSFIVSFPFWFLILRQIKVPCMEYGDWATWTGSGVAFLALIAAIVAALWSKRASDISNENNSFLYLSKLSEEKYKIFNEEFKNMQTCVASFFVVSPTVMFNDEMMRSRYIEYWSKLRVISGEMNNCFQDLEDTINHTKLSSLSKENIIQKFLRNIDPNAVWEMLLHSESKKVLEHRSMEYDLSEAIYDNYKPILESMQKREIFSDMFRLAYGVKAKN